MITISYLGFIEIMLKFRRRPVITKPNSQKEAEIQEPEESIQVNETTLVDEIPTRSHETSPLIASDEVLLQTNNDVLSSDEGVTIIRPIKGIDPELSSCLESSFCQNYPHSKLQILFCIDNPNDPSIPIIETLISKYPSIDSKILISSNFDETKNSSDAHFGPNPKVNNLAKGFLAAKYDILWIMDSNVWASSNILSNSVISLNENYNNGRKLNDSAKRKVKLVHHVPLALSINTGKTDRTGSVSDKRERILCGTTESETIHSLSPSLGSSTGSSSSNSSVSPSPGDYTDLEFAISPIQSAYSSSTNLLTNRNSPVVASSKPHFSSHKRLLKKFGARLDEMFLLTSHSKFYVALNNLAIAPCVNGKSNIYRKSDLDSAVSKMATTNDSQFFNADVNKEDALKYSSLGPGNSIKFFSRYIGEDNMIGIALWENVLGKTGLTGDVVIQPLSGIDNGVNDYITRRVRWLRVRKYMVLMATLVEPTTECIICSWYGNYAISTLFLNQWFSWRMFALQVLIWCITDYVQYYTLVYNITSNVNCDSRPSWLTSIPPLKRSVGNWLMVWVMREVLALPIWIIAMLGHEIDWRGKPFRINHDLLAEEL